MVLAQHFLRKEAKALKVGRVSFSPDAIAALSSHDWPGNVRELQNRIRRALAVFSGPMIMPGDLGLDQTVSGFGRRGADDAPGCA